MGARFEDDVVLVTGAAGQIGSRCVSGFAAERARVVAVDVSMDESADDNVLAVKADLTQQAEIESTFDAAEDAFGPVTVLVQSAAVYGRVPFLEVTQANLDRILAINVRALVLVAQRAARGMVDHGIGGAIVNLTSVSGLLSDGQSVGYEASKGAVTMATRSMAIALAPFRIRVNAVGPGNMVKAQESATVRTVGDLDEFERQRIPLGRLGTPEQVSQSVLFLASDAAAYITGEVLYVDGGALAAWSAWQPAFP